MNIEELEHLATWIKEHATLAQTKYQVLAGIAQHNSQQQQKKPLETALKDLQETLHEIPLHVLSNGQINLLSTFDLANLLGRSGVSFVDDTIKKTNFDPATASTELAKAVKTITVAIQRADRLITAFDGIDLHSTNSPLEDNRALVRIEFRGDASITNVVNWKEWSDKWHEIARGIVLSINEAPEDVRVVGATNGSIIIALTGTYAFVKILASIAKLVTNVAKDIVLLNHSIEDLRTKKLLNEKIENELVAEISTRKKSGVDTIIEETKKTLPDDIDGEQENALRKAITQLLEFNQKGGELDFVAPEVEDDVRDDETHAQIADLRAAIEDLRSEKETLKRLTYEDDE